MIPFTYCDHSSIYIRAVYLRLSKQLTGLRSDCLAKRHLARSVYLESSLFKHLSGKMIQVPNSSGFFSLIRILPYCFSNSNKRRSIKDTIL